MKSSAIYLFLVIFGLSACAGSSAGPEMEASNSGIREVEQYTIPAGTRQTISKDLVVFASEGIQIDGILEVEPGVSITLFSAGQINVTGEILGSDQEPLPLDTGFSLQNLFLGTAFAAPGELPDWILYGDGIAVAKNATIRSGNGSEILITTHDAQGKIEIDGTVKTPDGRDAKNRDENGQDAAWIQIGTQIACDHIKIKAKKLGKTLETHQPGYVRVSGTLDAGNGGDGFTDLKGVEDATKLLLRGTHGGVGGDIGVSADKLELTGTISAGQGGDGGGAGDPATDGTRARDGSKDGEKGFDLEFSTGSGGHGGNIEIMEGPLGQAKELEAGVVGRGGKAGWVYAAAGNGAFWGAGGNTLGKIGNIGSNGFLNSVIGDSTEALKGGGRLYYGGNGGYSTIPGHTGGNGGTLMITNPEGGKAELSSPLVIDNYGNGGDGFFGCGKPNLIGTHGGHSFVSPVVPLVMLGAPYTIASHSFSGGRGGDGEPTQGFGGTQGFDDAMNDVGIKGSDGRPCKKTSVVVLDHPLQGYAMGETISLDKIHGGQIGEPELGCTQIHLHASTREGIFIDGMGPFEDPNPSGCGFGLVILD